MSLAPARILKLDCGDLRVGACADITIFDPDKEWVVDSKQFYTRGKLTPFEGKRLKGKAIATIVGGQIVMEQGEVKR
jgi:dihydroorotase